MIQIGESAINFQAEALMNGLAINNSFDMFEYTKGKKTLLFFYPLDFTFVCPSELIVLNDRYNEFLDLNTMVLAISIDSVYSHLAWQSSTYDMGGVGELNFPMISDIKQDICRNYGVQHIENSVALRASIIIDENRILRHISINDLGIGRNIDELIRIIKAINHTNSGEVCPAQWRVGDKAIHPTKRGISDYLKENITNLIKK